MRNGRVRCNVEGEREEIICWQHEGESEECMVVQKGKRKCVLEG